MKETGLSPLALYSFDGACIGWPEARGAWGMPSAEVGSGTESRHRRVAGGRAGSNQPPVTFSPGHLGGKNYVSLHFVSCISLPEMS